MGKVITISREFGSGGHEIARKLSKETGFKMYDNELILEIVRNTNLSEELIKFYDEKPISKTFLPVKTEAISIIDQNIPLEQQIFIAQKEIMIAAAKNDNCIFVGRCANFIFKDYKDSLHFFIYSSLDKRINRKMEILNLSYQETKKIIEKNDKKRSQYYKANTGYDWGNRNIYDICINSGILGIDKSVDIIKKIIRG